MATVFLALGSNVGDSAQYIDDAIAALQAHITDIVQAPRYHTKPYGYTDQPGFTNTAIRGETDMQPLELLAFTQSLERTLGRQATFHWGPREIDIDIIFYDQVIMNTPSLTLPHPEFAQRDFVLRPIADHDPSFVDPRSGQTVSQLLAAIPASQRTIA